MDLYREHILEHAAHPRHWGELAMPTVTAQATNPVCGDRLQVQLLLEGGYITEIAFTGEGCAVSRAAASLLAEYVQGKPLAVLETVDAATLTDLLGVSITPARAQCAALPLQALTNARASL